MQWIGLIFSLFAMGLGADWLVRGCTKLAQKIGVSEFIVSIIVIGIGTTAPEIIVSIISAANGYGELAVGNAISSNIFRILGVLGMGLLLQPMNTGGHKRKIDIYFMFMATIAMMWACADGMINRLDGFVLFGIFVAYLASYIIKNRTAPYRKIHFANINMSHTIIPIITGIMILYFSSNYFMEILLEIVDKYNISTRMAGILIVAPGTSAPEIIITIIAALRKRASIILGNILGSNIANICLAIAGAAMVAPLPALDFLGFEVWVMVAVTAVFCWQMLHRRRLGRLTGTLYLITLGIFFWLV